MTVQIVGKFTPVCCMQMMCVRERIQHFFIHLFVPCVRNRLLHPMSIRSWIPVFGGYHTAIFL